MPNPSRPKSAPYFVNAPFDIAFVGGLSIVTWLVVRAFHGDLYSERAVDLSVLAMWVVNWPHFSATNYRLFRRRESAAQYPITAYVIPFVIASLVGASFKWPALVAPFFIKLFLLWSPYHFSGQSVGVSLVYARRQGITVGKVPRFLLSAFIFGTYFASTLRGETSAIGASYYSIDYPGLGVPAWMATAAVWGMYLAGTGFLAYAIRWSMQERRLFPFMALLPGITQYVWFISGASTQAFYVWVPFFHSLQYLPIAWAMQLGERLADGDAKPSRAFVTKETLWWAAVNLAGGVALFWALPHLAALCGIPLFFATGVLIAGVQIHHFFVDGVIWKLRRPAVVSPLLSNVRDYLEAGPMAQPGRAAA